MLDAMLAGTDAATVFQSGELLSELRQRLAERMPDAEMEVHLDQEVESERGNTRNGHNRKTVLTDDGSMPLAVPRDRQGTFEPQLAERHCRRLPGFDAKVIQLFFAHGLSTRHIQRTVQELYGVSVLPGLIAKVTDVVLDEYEAWQSRPLQERYPIVYLDAIQVKVRDAGSVTNRAVHLGIQWHSFSGFCHSVKDSVLGLGYPLIFYSVSGLSLPVFSFLAATFRSVFGIAAHRTYPDGAVADTGRSRQQYEPRFPGERRHAGVAGSRCWPPPPQVRA